MAVWRKVFEASRFWFSSMFFKVYFDVVLKKKMTSLLHIIRINLLSSFWVLHSLCEKVCLDYFLSGKGRSLTSCWSLHLCVRKIVVFNLFVAARDITLCRLQEDDEMKSLIKISFDKKKKRFMNFDDSTNLQRQIGMFLNCFEYLHYNHLVLIFF